ncbi:OTU domain-containing protein 7B-like, partial [Saccoglossus kowalevskii]
FTANKWDLEKAVLTYNEFKVVEPIAPAKVANKTTSNAGTSTTSSTNRNRNSRLPPSTDELENGRHISGGRKGFLERSCAIDATPDSPREKRLTRGISRANAPLVDRARLEKDGKDEEGHSHISVDTPVYTFVLPDLTVFKDEYRAFLEKDLIEMSSLVTLEHNVRLNWWAETGTCERLWPMATTGDGNCLLHAASLGLWGFHDRLLTLRKALYTTMSSGSKMAALKRRWRYYQTQLNKESGLVYNESEWEQEWDNLLKLANTEPRRGRRRSTLQSPLMTLSEDPNQQSEEEDNCTYDSLEEFHVFVLAHVLRRPIIVVADTVLRDADGEAFAPIPFGGIYLPLECKETECQKSPLLLTYDAAHFSALVAMDNDTWPPHEDESRKPR